MQGRKKMMLCVAFLTVVLLCMRENVSAATANGSKGNPYIVSTFDELKYSLTKGKRTSGTTYVAIKKTISMREVIEINEGKYIIYPVEKDVNLSKSTSPNDYINSEGHSGYCMKVGNKKDTELIFAANGSNKLTLGGKRSFFVTNNKTSSGWMIVGAKGKVIIENGIQIKNMINNDQASGLGNFVVYGILELSGYVENCGSKNGGFASIKDGGSVTMEPSAVIKKCDASTEGGAIWIKDKGKFIMNGGLIYQCNSGEEGGAVFCAGENAEARIKNGTIKENTSGESAGGIFSGYGATLYIGEHSKKGPYITNNNAKGSGGGIRANGGVGNDSGGTFYFWSGTVANNSSGKHGGGIAIGDSGDRNSGTVNINNAVINNNYSSKNGGGIYIGTGNTGQNGRTNIVNCEISENSSKEYGGGIYENSKCEISNTKIIGNTSQKSGGGMYIENNGEVYSYSATIEAGKASNNGSGILLKGKLNIGGNFRIEERNEIYIYTDKYINVDREFSYGSRLYAQVNSHVKRDGTKLIRVSYKGGNGQRLLYGDHTGEMDEYTHIREDKKFRHIDLSEYQLIRSAGMTKSIDASWIIISERFTVYYGSTNQESVKQLPKEQMKFFDEPIKISEDFPVRNEYEIDITKTWNTKMDGTGKRYIPGSEYVENKDLDLFAIWRRVLKITINAKDRYYITGQKIKLTEQEVLKKVVVLDNRKSGYKYPVKITGITDEMNGKVLFLGEKGLEEDRLADIISTQKATDFKLELLTYSSDRRVSDKATMKVFILPRKSMYHSVRFISKDYIDTLDRDSIWNEKENKKILTESLNGAPKHTWVFKEKTIGRIREFINDNKTNMKNDVNTEFYNKFLK